MGAEDPGLTQRLGDLTITADRESMASASRLFRELGILVIVKPMAPDVRRRLIRMLKLVGDGVIDVLQFTTSVSEDGRTDTVHLELRPFTAQLLALLRDGPVTHAAIDALPITIGSPPKAGRP